MTSVKPEIVVEYHYRLLLEYDILKNALCKRKTILAMFGIETTRITST